MVNRELPDFQMFGYFVLDSSFYFAVVHGLGFSSAKCRGLPGLCYSLLGCCHNLQDKMELGSGTVQSIMAQQHKRRVQVQSSVNQGGGHSEYFSPELLYNRTDPPDMGMSAYLATGTKAGRRESWLKFRDPYPAQKPSNHNFIIGLKYHNVLRGSFVSRPDIFPILRLQVNLQVSRTSCSVGGHFGQKGV